jgi:hypothetical protein
MMTLGYHLQSLKPQYEIWRAFMGWKTPKFEYVNGYKIVEIDGPAFQVYDGDKQLGDHFPYSGEAAAYANSLPKRDRQAT